uniref:Uncharacterized protein n=1 Tax=virus sp. ctL1g6 TaxID=2827988 RepID=A0A8S5REJ5_9VIRU|nr:MAG TPA: hypothetical protein [virus sp. ctL1g6]
MNFLIFAILLAILKLVILLLGMLVSVVRWCMLICENILFLCCCLCLILIAVMVQVGLCRFCKCEYVVVFYGVVLKVGATLFC